MTRTGPSAAFEDRLTDVRPPSCRSSRQLRLHAREQGVGGEGDRQISARPAGLGGDRASVARPEAERLLAAEAGDREGRRDARHAEHPRARGRDLLHDVQSRAGRALLRAALRHDAVHAARRRGHQGGAAQAHRRAGSCHGRRHVLVERGRMPRRLLQRADGSDQRRLLRGPDAGEFREAARRSRGGPSGQDRLADRPRLLRAGRRPDGADDALRRRRAQRAPGAPRAGERSRRRRSLDEAAAHAHADAEDAHISEDAGERCRPTRRRQQKANAVGARPLALEAPRGGGRRRSAAHQGRRSGQREASARARRLSLRSDRRLDAERRSAGSEPILRFLAASIASNGSRRRPISPAEEAGRRTSGPRPSADRKTGH